jgi:hypothetical protein
MVWGTQSRGVEEEGLRGWSETGGGGEGQQTGSQGLQVTTRHMHHMVRQYWTNKKCSCSTRGTGERGVRGKGPTSAVVDSGREATKSRAWGVDETMGRHTHEKCVGGVNATTHHGMCRG